MNEKYSMKISDPFPRQRITNLVDFLHHPNLLSYFYLAMTEIMINSSINLTMGFESLCRVSASLDKPTNN